MTKRKETIGDMLIELGYVISPIAYFCFYTVVLLTITRQFLGSEYAEINVFVSILVGLLILCEKIYMINVIEEHEKQQNEYEEAK